MKLLKNLGLDYLRAIVRFYDIWGVANRREVAGFVLGICAVLALFILEESTTGLTRTKAGIDFFVFLVFFHGLAGLTLVLRRLHDTGRSALRIFAVLNPWFTFYMVALIFLHPSIDLTDPNARTEVRPRMQKKPVAGVAAQLK